MGPLLGTEDLRHVAASSDGEGCCHNPAADVDGCLASAASVLLCGATGPDARFVNGLYDRKEGSGREPVFRSRRVPGRTDVDHPHTQTTWLYRAENGTWCVSTSESKDRRSPVCWAHTQSPWLASADDWQVTLGDVWEAQRLWTTVLSVKECSRHCRELSLRASLWAEKHSVRKAPALPFDALSWTEHESELWFRTRGRFHPRERGDRRWPTSPCSGPRQGRVSVITPTTESRQGFHRKLWACFEAQDWADKELVVVETFQQRRSAFLEELADLDPRLTYASFRAPLEEDWSIGLKRNICANLATGEFILHFDDDDLYATNYVPTMIRALDAGALAVKLVTWFIFDKASGTFGSCDPAAVGREQGLEADVVRQRTYGYGFSYVYRSEVLQQLQFPDVSFGEDFQFLSALQRLHGDGSVALIKDESGICVHMQHGRNTSQASCVMQRTLHWEEVPDLDFADLPRVFDNPLQTHGPTDRDPHRRRGKERRWRELLVHTPLGPLRLSCPVGALGSDVMWHLEEQMGDLPFDAQLWWIPAPDEVSQEELEWRTHIAIENLSPGLLARSWASDLERDELCTQLHTAIPARSRVGARTTELWLSIPGDWSADPGIDNEPRIWVRRSSPSVRIICDELPSRDSVSRIFHLLVPMDATVERFRRMLGSRLPEWAEVCARRPGLGRVALSDEEPLPDKVMLSDFAGMVTAEMLVTKQQCHELMVQLLATVQSTKVQRTLDAFEEEAKGDEAQYRAKLAFLLLDEIYPEVSASFGLLPTCACMRALKQTITFHMLEDMAMYEISVSLEAALRNRTALEGNLRILERLRAEQWWS